MDKYTFGSCFQFPRVLYIASSSSSFPLCGRQLVSFGFFLAFDVATCDLLSFCNLFYLMRVLKKSSLFFKYCLALFSLKNFKRKLNALQIKMNWCIVFEWRQCLRFVCTMRPEKKIKRKAVVITNERQTRMIFNKLFSFHDP